MVSEHLHGRGADVAEQDSIEIQIIQAAHGRGAGDGRKGDWDKVVHLLDYHGINPNSPVCAKTDYSLLSLAATEAAPDACQTLIAMGADPRNGGKWSRTPLINMVYSRGGTWGSRHRKVVDILRSTVDEQDGDGRTALMFASTGAGLFGSKRGNLRLVKQLIDLGADLSLRDRRGRTALMHAVAFNDASPVSANAEVVRLLENTVVEREARRLFDEQYEVVFFENGETTLVPKTLPFKAPPAPLQPPMASPPNGRTRLRAARADASVQAIAAKIEDFFGLPEDSVALVDKKRKPLRWDDTIGLLWKKHSK